MTTTIFTAIIVVILMFVGVGFLVRGVFGPRAATAYQHQIQIFVNFVIRHTYRFLRWAWLGYWRYILTFVAGFMVAVYWMRI